MIGLEDVQYVILVRPYIGPGRVQTAGVRTQDQVAVQQLGVHFNHSTIKTDFEPINVEMVEAMDTYIIHIKGFGHIAFAVIEPQLETTTYLEHELDTPCFIPYMNVIEQLLKTELVMAFPRLVARQPFFS